MGYLISVRVAIHIPIHSRKSPKYSGTTVLDPPMTQIPRTQSNSAGAVRDPYLKRWYGKYLVIVNRWSPIKYPCA